MSTLSLRIPDSLHEQLKKLAKKDHVSINQFITTAISEKMAALMTEEYLEEKAQQADKARFQKVLGKVADTEPNEQDRL